MKIKGHSKIELRDAKTGIITDVREQDNFVTEFPSELFKQMGYLRPNAFANRESNPLDDLFGGIMCFDSAITENADMTGRHSSPLFAPASKTMTANGSVLITGNSEPSEMGQYNSNESVASDGFVRRFVYDWDTDEGNGPIGCVCLTSKYGGYMGVGNASSRTRNVSHHPRQPLEQRPSTDTTNFSGIYTYNNTRVLYINWSTNVIGVIQGLDFSTGVLVVAEYDTSLVSINPFKNLGRVDYSRKIREVTYNFTPITDSIQGWYCFSRFWYFGIVTFSNHNSDDSKINVIKFNLDNTQEQYRFVGMRFGYTNGTDGRYGKMSFGFLGDYFISCNGGLGTYTGSMYIQAANTATGVITNLGNPDPYSNTGDINRDMVILEDRAYFGSSVIRIINGSPVREQTNGYSGFTQPVGCSGAYNFGQAIDNPYIIFNCGMHDYQGEMISEVKGTLLRQYLATISNLQDPVVKTADKTMKITYTLTLLEQN